MSQFSRHLLGWTLIVALHLICVTMLFGVTIAVVIVTFSAVPDQRVIVEHRPRSVPASSVVSAELYEDEFVTNDPGSDLTAG